MTMTATPIEPKQPEKIMALPPELEARLPEIRDKWIAIGLATGPCDREKAQEYLKLTYTLVGLEPPTTFIWRDSPLAGMKAAQELLMEGRAEGESAPSLSCGYGHHDASWLGFYEVFKDLVPATKQLEGLWGLAEIGWWWPFETTVVATERPVRLSLDPEKRMHSETGKAVEYSDGWGVYCWHGVRIPGDWIENRDTLDPTIALTWENVEQRRAAAEIIGWDRVLEKVAAKVIDEDSDPEIGTLLSADLPDSPDSRFLKVLCGTGRAFILPVPQDMLTARQANAWTYDLQPEELQLEVRT